jgi:acyl carrier protein
MSEDTRAHIRAFITGEVLFDRGGEAPRDEAPLLDGVLDSLGLNQMIAFIEDEFGLEVSDAEMSTANFRTIAAIDELVERKLALRSEAS